MCASGHIGIHGLGLDLQHQRFGIGVEELLTLYVLQHNLIVKPSSYIIICGHTHVDQEIQHHPGHVDGCEVITKDVASSKGDSHKLLCQSRVGNCVEVRSW